MWEILSDSSWGNPLWLVILIVSGLFGMWLGYDSNRLKRKHSLKEGKDIKIRDDIRTYIFLFLFMVGIFGLLRRLYQVFF